MIAPVTNEELARLLVEDPDDEARYVAYADWLQEKGHPRGELIALDLALEKDGQKVELEAARAALLAREAPALLGETFSKVVAEGYGTIAWRRGFVDEVSYVGTELPHQRAVGWLVQTMCDEWEPFLLLRRLSLRKTDISDVKPLTRFARLAHLDVAQSRVVDIAPLAELKHLEVVDLRFTMVAKDAREALQARGIRVR